jgi:hypothetical protein
LLEWVAQLGAKTLYIEPGSPWENGYCENFTGKLRDECLKLEMFYSLKEAQVVIDAWRDHDSRVRPHFGLPATCTYHFGGYRTTTTHVRNHAVASQCAWFKTPVTSTGNGTTRARTPLSGLRLRDGVRVAWFRFLDQSELHRRRLPVEWQLKWNSTGGEQALTLCILNFKHKAWSLDASAVLPMIEADPIAQCIALAPVRQR